MVEWNSFAMAGIRSAYFNVKTVPRILLIKRHITLGFLRIASQPMPIVRYLKMVMTLKYSWQVCAGIHQYSNVILTLPNEQHTR
jgi:hypothetical protein